MWLARSPDLIHWGAHAPLTVSGGEWQSGRVGAGTPPIRVADGWLEIYHGNRQPTRPGEVGTYYGGALLLDPDDPAILPGPIGDLADVYFRDPAACHDAHPRILAMDVATSSRPGRAIHCRGQRGGGRGHRRAPTTTAEGRQTPGQRIRRGQRRRRARTRSGGGGRERDALEHEARSGERKTRRRHRPHALAVREADDPPTSVG